MIDTLTVELPANPAELQTLWVYYGSPKLPAPQGDDLIFAWVARQWAEHRQKQGLRIDCDLDAEMQQGPPTQLHASCDVCGQQGWVTQRQVQSGEVACIKCNGTRVTVDLRQSQGPPPRFVISTTNQEKTSP